VLAAGQVQVADAPVTQDAEGVEPFRRDVDSALGGGRGVEEDPLRRDELAERLVQLGVELGHARAPRIRREAPTMALSSASYPAARKARGQASSRRIPETRREPFPAVWEGRTRGTTVVTRCALPVRVCQRDRRFALRSYRQARPRRSPQRAEVRHTAVDGIAACEGARACTSPGRRILPTTTHR